MAQVATAAKPRQLAEMWRNAIEAAGGGRSSAISRRMSANRFLISGPAVRREACQRRANSSDRQGVSGVAARRPPDKGGAKDRACYALG